MSTRLILLGHQALPGGPGSTSTCRVWPANDSDSAVASARMALHSVRGTALRSPSACCPCFKSHHRAVDMSSLRRNIQRVQVGLRLSLRLLRVGGESFLEASSCDCFGVPLRSAAVKAARFGGAPTAQELAVRSWHRQQAALDPVAASADPHVLGCVLNSRDSTMNYVYRTLLQSPPFNCSITEAVGVRASSDSEVIETRASISW